MITKSDIIILLISSSVLMLGLYRTFDGQTGFSDSFSFFRDSRSVNSESVQSRSTDSESAGFESVAAVTGAKPQTIAANDGIQAKVLQQPVTGAATLASKPLIPSSANSPSGARLVPRSDKPVVAHKQTTNQAKENPVTRVPGNTTVLVLSPLGTKARQSTIKESSNEGGQEKTNKPVVESAGSPASLLAELTDGEQHRELSNTVLQTQAEEVNEAPIKIHQVQSGENLSVIAARLGTSVERLKTINRLSSDRILAGQNLVYEN